MVLEFGEADAICKFFKNIPQKMPLLIKPKGDIASNDFDIPQVSEPHNVGRWAVDAPFV
jgi:hypothetical protein